MCSLWAWKPFQSLFFGHMHKLDGLITWSSITNSNNSLFLGRAAAWGQPLLKASIFLLSRSLVVQLANLISQYLNSNIIYLFYCHKLRYDFFPLFGWIHSDWLSARCAMCTVTFPWEIGKWYFVTKIVQTCCEKNLFFTRTIYSNSERSEQFLVTECFFNLFLKVSHI